MLRGRGRFGAGKGPSRTRCFSSGLPARVSAGIYELPRVEMMQWRASPGAGRKLRRESRSIAAAATCLCPEPLRDTALNIYMLMRGEAAAGAVDRRARGKSTYPSRGRVEKSVALECIPFAAAAAPPRETLWCPRDARGEILYNMTRDGISGAR